MEWKRFISSVLQFPPVQHGGHNHPALGGGVLVTWGEEALPRQGRKNESHSGKDGASGSSDRKAFAGQKKPQISIKAKYRRLYSQEFKCPINS